MNAPLLGSKVGFRPKVRPAPALQSGRKPRLSVPAESPAAKLKSYSATGKPEWRETIGLMDHPPATALTTPLDWLPQRLPCPNGISYVAYAESTFLESK